MGLLWQDSCGAMRNVATWPSGKARVCKTLITGSNPVVASNPAQQHNIPPLRTTGRDVVF